MRLGLRIAILVGFGLVSAALAIPASRRPVDVENHAMKAAGTPEAAVEAVRDREFGVDRTVILCLEARAGATAPSPSDPDVRSWLAGLRDRPEVARVLPPLHRQAEGAIVFVVEVAADGDGRHGGPATAVARFAAESAPPPLRCWATGQVLGEVAIAQALVREQGQLVPIIVLVLFALLWLATGQWILAVAPLLPALAGVLWIEGVQGWLGVAIDPVGSLQAPVLLTVGVAGAVHLLEAFRDGVDSGLARDVAIARSVRVVRAPAVLTMATTVAGFLALWISDIPAVQRFGTSVAVGVAVTQGFAFLLVPLWLSVVGQWVRPRRTNVWSGFSLWLGAFTRRRGGVVQVGSAVLLAGGLVLASQLRVDTDPIRVLPENHPFRTSADEVARVLGGIETFELFLPPPGPPLPVVQAARLSLWLAAQDEVALPAGPVRRSEQGSYLVGAVLGPGGSAAREDLFGRAEAEARAMGWPEARAAGPSVQVSRDSGALVRGQALGMAATLLVIWLLMISGFRSLLWGTLGLLPNVLPCALLYGCLSAAGRPLSVGSAMIGSAMLGLMVDDTIHFLHGYARRRRAGAGGVSAVVRSLRHAGRAVTMTSAALGLGFCATLFGSLDTSREFGILAAGSIGVALLADLILLPSILLYWPRPSR